eukprot:TRINITY_DN105291_c0_g1_i1.p1 TRINITY_DN105291_c0_g1~~TRINITY_DN105291_c0_g1_i1.p1  ORF type:complete len:396 (+),score=72.65 TRINITY_DN105291_c0_g1_i1:81-1268(+)
MDGGGEFEEKTGQYSWENKQERSWEDLKEDESGNLTYVTVRSKRNRKRAKQECVFRGMMQYVSLVVDLSTAMNATDYQPSNLVVATNELDYFLEQFFEHNPISNMSVIVTRDEIAQRISRMSPEAETHRSQLKTNLFTSGRASLVNSLETALIELQDIPAHGVREILVLWGSYSTADPCDPSAVIKRLKHMKVRVSFVSLTPELYICRHIAEETGGSFAVARDAQHLRQSLLEHCKPPTISSKPDIGCVSAGFPSKEMKPRGVICMCHRKLVRQCFICPKCGCPTCRIPIECPSCSLYLVSASHLSRSARHLVPMPTYEPCQAQKDTRCFGCNAICYDEATKPDVFKCVICSNVFCDDCDEQLQENISNCPGCLMNGLSFVPKENIEDEIPMDMS